MIETWAVVCIFLLSITSTVGLILHRPFLNIRLGQSYVRMETYFLGALLAPVLILVFGFMRSSDMLAGLEGSAGLDPVGILALFLSMVFISIFLDITGVFEFCARMALRIAGHNRRKLFLSLYITVSILTLFTSNDILILTFTPLVVSFCRQAKLPATPYLIAEFFAANTWSMLLVVGNPTNILIAGAFHLDFLRYALWMILPTFAAGGVQVILLLRVFRRELTGDAYTGPSLKPSEAITDRWGAVLGTGLLAACIAGLAMAPRWGIPLWHMALASAMGLLLTLIARRSWARFLRQDRSILMGGPGFRQSFRRMPWPIIPFILSQFIAVEALRLQGISSTIAASLQSWCGSSVPRAIALYGVLSTLTANLVNNIPMTLGFTSLLDGLTEPSLRMAALSTIIGSNLGANLTPIGALAGLMWMSLLREKDVPISFFQFVIYGLWITPLSLFASLAVLCAQAAWTLRCP